jgi:hypothetical protein
VNWITKQFGRLLAERGIKVSYYAVSRFLERKGRGRLDEGRTTPPRAGAPRELVEAMRAIATTGVAPADQKASIGCSIKWKD